MSGVWSQLLPAGNRLLQPLLQYSAVAVELLWGGEIVYKADLTRINHRAVPRVRNHWELRSRTRVQGC